LFSCAFDKEINVKNPVIKLIKLNCDQVVKVFTMLFVFVTYFKVFNA